MRDRFGIRATAAAIIAVALLPGVTTATAQETDYLAPRTAAGTPDLNGIGNPSTPQIGTSSPMLRLLAWPRSLVPVPRCRRVSASSTVARFRTCLKR